MHFSLSLLKSLIDRIWFLFSFLHLNWSLPHFDWTEPQPLPTNKKFKEWNITGFLLLRPFRLIYFIWHCSVGGRWSVGQWCISGHKKSTSFASIIGSNWTYSRCDAQLGLMKLKNIEIRFTVWFLGIKEPKTIYCNRWLGLLVSLS